MLEPKLGSILTGGFGDEDFWRNLLSANYGINLRGKQSNQYNPFDLFKVMWLKRASQFLLPVRRGTTLPNFSQIGPAVWLEMSKYETDGQTVRDDNTLSGIEILEKLKIECFWYVLWKIWSDRLVQRYHSYFSVILPGFDLQTNYMPADRCFTVKMLHHKVCHHSDWC